MGKAFSQAETGFPGADGFCHRLTAPPSLPEHYDLKYKDTFLPLAMQENGSCENLYKEIMQMEGIQQQNTIPAILLQWKTRHGKYFLSSFPCPVSLSGTYEVILVPVKEDRIPDRESICRMICEVNETEVADMEILSDHPYFYNFLKFPRPLHLCTIHPQTASCWQNHVPAVLGCSHMPFLPQEKGQNISPVIYLNPYYRSYLDGRDMERIADDIYRCYLKNKPADDFDISCFTDFEHSHCCFSLWSLPWPPHPLFPESFF